MYSMKLFLFLQAVIYVAARFAKCLKKKKKLRFIPQIFASLVYIIDFNSCAILYSPVQIEITLHLTIISVGLFTIILYMTMGGPLMLYNRRDLDL